MNNENVENFPEYMWAGKINCECTLPGPTYIGTVNNTGTVISASILMLIIFSRLCYHPYMYNSRVAS